MSADKPVTERFGFGATHTGDDGAERYMELVELSTGGFVVRIETKWPDHDEPAITKFGLSATGLGMLTELLSNAPNIRNYPVPAA